VRGLLPFAVLATSFVGACGQSSTNQLESICKRESRVIVYDASAWQQYVVKVQGEDLKSQRGVLSGRKSGAITGPTDKSPWLAPFSYVPGYDWENDKPRWADTPKPGNIPERNDIKVLHGDRLIARLVNFDVIQRGFDYSPLYSCANRFPEVFRISRAKVLA
jgi:hypothetical protein